MPIHNNTDTKSAINSTAVQAGAIGMLVFLARMFAGWDVNSDDVSPIVSNIDNIKGSLLGFTASAGVMVSRFKAVNFDKSIFKTKTFWASVGKIVAILLTLVGVGDNEINMEKLAGDGFDIASLAIATVTSGAAIYGRVTAAKKLTL